MRTVIFSIALIGLLLPTVIPPAGALPRSTSSRYAVVGNSLAAGEGTSDPANLAYPARIDMPAVSYSGRCVVRRCYLWLPMIGSLDTAIEAVPAETTTLIFEMGVNDLNWGVNPQRLIYGLQTLSEEARDLGYSMVFTTLTPPGYFDTNRVAHRDLRRVVNAWIRTQPTYVDFDRALANRGGYMKREYDSRDGLHPNDAGARRLAVTLKNWIGAQP